MARLRNTSASTEFTLKVPEIIRLGLEALAAKHGLRNSNESAYLLIRQGLELDFGRIGSEEFFAACRESAETVTAGMAGLRVHFPTHPQEEE
jgi:hypothetical protein